MSKIFDEVRKGNLKATHALGRINAFMIAKRDSIVLEETGHNNLVRPMEANVIQTGYAFSNDLKVALRNLDENTLNYVYEGVLKALKEEKGAHVDHSNFIFPNFPNQTRVTDLSTLSNVRFVGYLCDVLELITGDEYHNLIGLGKYAEHKERTPLEIDKSDLIMLNVATMDDVHTIVYNLLGSRMALSEYDKEFIDFALQSDYIDNSKIIPKEIPFKETWAMLIRYAVKYGLELPIEFKNFYDFKRAYAALIGEDVSLSTNFKLRNLLNQERVFLLSKLNEGCIKYPKFMIESMYKESEFVVLINNRLHPTGYKNRFSEVVHFFDRIKSGEKVQTDDTLIETLLKEGKGFEAFKVAIANPGIAVRRLAHTLSLENIENQKTMVDMLSKKATVVDLSVLLNTKAYFESRNDSNIRVAMPKGNAKKSRIFIDEKELTPEICDYVITMLQKAIDEKLGEKETLQGKNIYVDEVLKKYNVPFGTRNESKALRSVARGSRLTLDEKTNVLRAFVYKKIRGGGFVDLSCAFLNSEFNFLEQCSWTNLKTDDSSKPLAMHSGDGYNCQNGLDEFIDIDLSVLKTNKPNVKYIAFQVLSYNHIPFEKMDECFFGVMSRKSMFNDVVGKGSDMRHPKFHHHLTKEEQANIDFNGEVFEPSTVKFRFDLSGPETVNMPLLYDVENGEFIWVDLAVNMGAFTPNSVDNSLLLSGNVVPFNKSLCIENLQDGTIAACYSVVYLQKPNLYDLFVSNVNARGGNLVANKDEANIVCSLEGDVTPFYRDIITKEWM